MSLEHVMDRALRSTQEYRARDVAHHVHPFTDQVIDPRHVGRRQRNQAVKSRLKTAVRKFRELSEAGDKDAALAAARDASKKLDKAASRGVIHKNQAANRKSSIAKKAAAL